MTRLDQTGSGLVFFGGTRFSALAGPWYLWAFWIAAGSAVLAVGLGLTSRAGRSRPAELVTDVPR